jgi:hypothetical protein
LKKQVDFLENNSDYVIAYHDSIMIDGNDKLIEESEVGIQNQRDFTAEELQKGAFISARTICFRNLIVLKKSDYKKVFNEDYFLFAILGEHGGGKFISDIKPAVYRILKNGVWSSLSEIHRQIALLSTIKSIEKFYLKKRNLKLVKEYNRKKIETINRIFYLSKIERMSSVFFCFAIKSYFSNVSVYNSHSKRQIVISCFNYIFSKK